MPINKSSASALLLIGYVGVHSSNDVNRHQTKRYTTVGVYVGCERMQYCYSRVCGSVCHEIMPTRPNKKANFFPILARRSRHSINFKFKRAWFHLLKDAPMFCQII